MLLGDSCQQKNVESSKRSFLTNTVGDRFVELADQDGEGYKIRDLTRKI